MNNPENNMGHRVESEKPPILYHGSPTKDLEELEPRNKSYRDPEEGPVIFAAPDLAIATVFLLRGVAALGKFDDVPYAIIIGDREKFIANDKGGYVYVLPSDTFYNDPTKGLRADEWISREKVRAQKRIDYPSALDAAIESGVQVYFIDKPTYQNLRDSKDHGASILHDLQSENQRRGVNVKTIPSVED